MTKSRREFLKEVGVAAGAAAFPAILPSRVLGENAPSKRITLGFIGMGAQGLNVNLKMFLNEPDAQVLAVCDAYRSRADSAANMVNQRTGTTDCKSYQDFRKIIEDPAIDAVVISTPDHWHVPMSMMALQAGKDVFCEKPTHCIHEGADLVREVEKRGAVFQAGIEDRSIVHFHKMVEWVKNGAIGKLTRAEVTLPKGTDFPREEPVDPPEDLDWNLWLGPAPFHPYTANRTNMWRWRNISDYGNGALLDMGTHLVDTAQLGVHAPDVCPVEVEGTGDIPAGGVTDLPVTFDLTYRYAHDVVMTVKNGPGGGWSPDSCSIRFEGEKGWIRRKTWSAGIEASDPSILRTRYAPRTTETDLLSQDDSGCGGTPQSDSKQRRDASATPTRHWPLPPREQRNFLDCVKSRKPTTYPAKDLHDMSTTLHMGNIAIALGRKLNWDTEKEIFINDDEANKLCKRPTARVWEAGLQET